MKNAFNILLFIFGIGIYYAGLVGHEYIYPVASLMHNNEKYIYLMHQTAWNHVDLLLWNPRTKETQKVLLSKFTPAGLQIIPGGGGFSFIDHDTLRIKMHHKRSPQLVDFDEFLYDLTLIFWINENTFYFSARNNINFGIYQASLKGHCDCIIASQDYDCLYPQKVNNSLFYIERDKELRHKIICAEDIMPLSYQEDPYNYIHFQRKTDSVKKKYNNNISKSLILDKEKTGCAFLYMISEKEGFFIEHPATITKEDTNITFLYHHIYYDSILWRNEVLFNFTIPVFYFMHNNENCLYESILPFLPRYIPNYGFLFVDISHDHVNLNLKFYSKMDKTIKTAFHQENQSMFGAFVDNDILYCGGIVLDESQPRMWLANNGILCVDLLSIKLNDIFT